MTRADDEVWGPRQVPAAANMFQAIGKTIRWRIALLSKQGKAFSFQSVSMVQYSLLKQMGGSPKLRRVPYITIIGCRGARTVR